MTTFTQAMGAQLRWVAGWNRWVKIALVLVLATLAGLFLLTRYPLKCPRCRANFYRGLVGPFAETNRCAHCRIKIGTTKADADEADRVRGSAR